jgi:hypothetical protein
MSVLFSDLPFQRFSCLKLCELSFKAEDNWYDSALSFTTGRIDYFAAEIAVPFLAARNDPSLLGGGKRAGCLYFSEGL